MSNMFHILSKSYFLSQQNIFYINQNFKQIHIQLYGLNTQELLRNIHSDIHFGSKYFLICIISATYMYIQDGSCQHAKKSLSTCDVIWYPLVRHYLCQHVILYYYIGMKHNHVNMHNHTAKRGKKTFVILNVDKLFSHVVNFSI